jgi:hypothetical protein
MKKLIRVRIVAALCLFLRRKCSSNHRHRRRISRLQQDRCRMQSAMARFFKHNPPEMVRYFTILIFQCWAVNDCKVRSNVSDRDFAEFLDQLNDFVSETHRWYNPHRKPLKTEFPNHHLDAT